MSVLICPECQYVNVVVSCGFCLQCGIDLDNQQLMPRRFSLFRQHQLRRTIAWRCWPPQLPNGWPPPSSTGRYLGRPPGDHGQSTPGRAPGPERARHDAAVNLRSCDRAKCDGAAYLE